MVREHNPAGQMNVEHSRFDVLVAQYRLKMPYTSTSSQVHRGERVS